MDASEECIVLLDNGSLRPESVFSLRKIAGNLERALGKRVHPVSLLHSSKIPSDRLEGVEADTWRRFLRRRLEEGGARFRIVPLFFGPSSALVDYLPQVTAEVFGELGEATIRIARPLLDVADAREDSVARILAGYLIRKLDTLGEQVGSTGVIVVDHGSPLREVADCRDRVVNQVAGLLGGRVESVVAASMERRDGDEYAFNEPLLVVALDRAVKLGWRRLLLSYLFFSPGRHAGPRGDIDQIVAESDFVKKGGLVVSMPLVGESPELTGLLVKRFKELDGLR